MDDKRVQARHASGGDAGGRTGRDEAWERLTRIAHRRRRHGA